MRRLTIATILGVTALVACSDASPGDFKEQGEDFINDDEGIEDRLGTDFSDAECEEPSSTEIGTTYACTSAGADGNEWRWTVEITDEEELTVRSGEPVT